MDGRKNATSGLNRLRRGASFAATVAQALSAYVSIGSAGEPHSQSQIRTLPRHFEVKCSAVNRLCKKAIFSHAQTFIAAPISERKSLPNHDRLEQWAVNIVEKFDEFFCRTPGLNRAPVVLVHCPGRFRRNEGRDAVRHAELGDAIVSMPPVDVVDSPPIYLRGLGMYERLYDWCLNHVGPWTARC
jgi:hypothetical protein